MTFTSFWLEYRFVGLKPGLSHVVNALLHAGSVLMLWNVLRRLAVPGAWAAAAVFAVHPINVESVAWISERKNTLSLLLALSSAWMYLRYADIGVETRTVPAGEGLNVALPDDPKRLYRLFLALFALAVLAKTAVAVLPVLLAVVVWWQRGRLTKSDLLPLVPAVVLGAAAGAVTSYLEHSPDFVGATGREWDVSLPQRVMLVGQTTAFYAYKILWPFAVAHRGGATVGTVPLFPISFNYEKWALNTTSVVQWLPLAAVLATLGALAAGVRRVGRGPLAAALLFLVGLLPASGLFTFFPQRFSWVADHFAYVGSIGLIAGVVAGAAVLLRRAPAVAAGVAGVLLAGMVAVTFWHALAFKDLQSLWKRTLQQNPRSWLAAVSYGVVLMDRANLDAARLSKMGDEAAAAAKRAELRDDAELWFEQALRLNPDAYEAYRSQGALAVQRGKPDQAIALYRQSEQAAARMGAVGYRWPAFFIGDLLIAQGKTEEGLAIFEDLEKLEPRLGKRSGTLFAQIRTKRGDVLLNRVKGKIQPDNMEQADRDLLDAAIEQYAAAIDISPDYVPPKLRLARLLIDVGNPREALVQIDDVLKLDPINADAKFLTAKVAVSQGLYEAAVSQLGNLLAIHVDYLPAHLELARVLKSMGHADAAAVELKRTLTLYPNQPDADRMLADLEGRPATRPATTRAD